MRGELVEQITDLRSIDCDRDPLLVTERDRAVTEKVTEQNVCPVKKVTEVTEQNINCTGENNQELVADPLSDTTEEEADWEFAMTPVTPPS